MEEIGKKRQKKISRREQAQAKQKRRETITSISLWIVGLGFAYLVVSNLLNQRPSGAELGEVMESEEGRHVERGTPLEFDTNPPNSGVHFAEPMPAGFYEDTPEDPLTLPQPEGHIVHALEHGYVAIWYNCDLAEDCEALKDNLRAVWDDLSTKLIVYPWPSGETVVGLSSWGHILILDNFDEEVIKDFVLTYRSHPDAPEYTVP